MATKIIRTIHPIGQGAFYSEELIFDNDIKSLLVVYDCGSGLGDSVDANAQPLLRKWAKSHSQIDILFVSHFHNDHINGIKTLMDNGVYIKNIIMPYIAPQVINMLCTLQTKLQNANIATPFQDPYLMLNGANLKGTRFIYVGFDREIPMEGRLDIEQDLQNLEDIEGQFIDITSGSYRIDNKYYLLSGSLYGLGDWFYMPFMSTNISFDTQMINTLNDLLETINAYEKENKNEWIADKEKIDMIRKQYKKICKNINETSLMVFSSPISLNTCLNYRKKILGNPLCVVFVCDNFISKSGLSNKYPTCLYTGDLPFSESVWRDVVEKLRNRKIGNFQVPHHGSRYGWKKGKNMADVLFDDTSFFFSYGTRNKFKHPHKDFIEYFSKNNKNLCGVHELFYSELCQEYVISY